MTLQNLIRKRWVKISLGFVATIILFVVLLPLGIKYYLIHWLEQNGAESASIETFSFNPFLGRITLSGLDVQGGKRSILNHSNLVIDLDLTSIFHRNIRVEKAEYRDLYIDMEQFENGHWRYGSYTMSSEPKAQTLNPPDPSAPGWGFHADNILVENCRIHVKTPEIDLTLIIDKAELNKFASQGENAGELTLQGKIDDSPINLMIDTLKVHPGIEVNGTIQIAGFDVSKLEKLLQSALPKFNGLFGLNGKVIFTISDESGMATDYQGTVTFENGDIGGGDFQTAAQTMHWDGSVHYAAPLDKPAEVGTNGLLAVRGLSLKVPAANLTLKNEEIDFEGTIGLTLGEQLALAHDGALSMKSTTMQLPDLTLGDETLTWKGQVNYVVAAKATTIGSKGSLQLGGIDLNKSGTETPLTVKGKAISWNGTADVALANESGTSKIDLGGTLAGSSLITTLSEPQLQVQQGQVKLQTKTSLTLGKTFGVSAKSGLEIGAFTMKQGTAAETLDVGFDKLTISGLANTGTTAISAADLRIAQLKAGIPGDLPVAVSVPELQLTTLVTEDLETFTFGSLALQNLQIDATYNNSQLAELGQLSMQNIVTGKEGKFGAEHLILMGLTLLRSSDTDTPAVLTLAGAATDTLNWGPESGLQSDALTLDKLAVNIDRDKDGAMNFAKELAAMQKNGAQATSEPAQPQATPATGPATTPPGEVQATRQATEKTLPIQIAAITLSKDSTVAFRDQTMTVPYATSLNIEKFSLQPLDSTQPDKGSDLLLEGKLEKNAPLKITGTIKPFKSKPDLELDLVLKNYPLTSLSPYTVQAVGTALAKGNLKLTTKVALAGDKIDIKNNVVLAGLKTNTISPELAAELNNQLPVPLDAALAMMRDGDGNISLNIPINGPLDNLNVGIASIIVKALNKSIVSAASSYFVYTLGPYAALAYVGMKVGEKMLQVKLPPVIFEPQAQELTDEHKDYLQRIAKILTDNKDQDLRLTPHAPPRELQPQEEEGKTEKNTTDQPEKPDAEMQQQLEHLAEQRTAAITAFLIDEHDIDKLRILVSDPVVDTAKEAKPMVMLEVK